MQNVDEVAVLPNWSRIASEPGAQNCTCPVVYWVDARKPRLCRGQGDDDHEFYSGAVVMGKGLIAFAMGSVAEYVHEAELILDRSDLVVRPISFGD